MLNNQFILGLKAQRATLVEQIHHIDAMLRLNGVDSEEIDLSYGTASPQAEMPYKKGDSWQIKFASLIKSNNRFISINEAANMVNTFEPKISIEEAKKGLGSAKNMMLKDKAIAKFQYGSNNSNTFYGKPTWLNDDGSIKDDYKFNSNALVVKPKVEI